MPNTDKNALITGGCGFIGVNLCLYLLERNWNIRVLDNFSSMGPELLQQACEEHGFPVPDLHEGDVRNAEDVNEAVRGMNAVVHLAAFTSVLKSVQYPQIDLDINSRGTFRVLEGVRQSDSVDQFVFASSNAAVGEVEGAVNEESVPQPLSPYGASKLHGEALCSTYANTYGLSTTALRFANAYGPHSGHKTSVIHKFIRRARDGKPLEIYGDGEQTRDFIHVRDIAAAIHAVLTSDRDGYDVYQVASGEETSINQMVERLRRIGHEASGLAIETNHTDERDGEIRKNYSTYEKIASDLGWEPEVSLEDGLKQVWDWYCTR